MSTSIKEVQALRKQGVYYHSASTDGHSCHHVLMSYNRRAGDRCTIPLPGTIKKGVLMFGIIPSNQQRTLRRPTYYTQIDFIDNTPSK